MSSSYQYSESSSTYDITYGAAGAGAPVSEVRLLDGSFDVNRLTVEQLQYELERRSLDSTGTKIQLRERFLDYLMKKLHWRSEKLMSDAKQRRDAIHREQSGSVYAAGLHVGPTSGKGTKVSEYAVVEELSGCQPVQVAAGENYALVLTKMGDVYAFGHRDAFILPEEDHLHIFAGPGRSDFERVAGGTRSSFTSLPPSRASVGASQVGAAERSMTQARMLAAQLPPLKSDRTPWTLSPLPTADNKSASGSRPGSVPPAAHTWGSHASRPLVPPIIAEIEGHIDAVEHTRSPPQLIPGLVGESIHGIRAGFGYASALSDAGDLYIWGKGPLPYQTSAIDERLATRQHCIPVQVVPVDNVALVDICFGGTHALLLDGSGVLYTWGTNTRYCLGVSEEDGATPTLQHIKPAPVPRFASSLLKITTISCSNMHVLACVGGEVSGVYSWGRGDGYRLGHGDQEDRLIPTLITELSGKQIKSVLAVPARSFAIAEVSLPALVKSKNQLLAWGTGTHGQLGLGGQIAHSPLPTPLVFFDTFDKSIRLVRGSISHTAAITTDGELYVWGTNKYGALGLPLEDTRQAVEDPAKILHFDCLLDGVGRGKPLDVACGTFFTVVACEPFELSEETRLGSSEAALETATSVYRTAQLRRMEEETLRSAAEREAKILEENRKRFREAQPCMLCQTCEGFKMDELAPTMCLTCGHLKTRHNIN